MGYVIVGILCFICGFILNTMIKQHEVKGKILDKIEVKEIAKKTAEKKMKEIKEKLGKEIKGKERDEIINSVDNYFDKYYPDGYSG